MKIIFFWKNIFDKLLVESLIGDILQDKVESKLSYKINVLEKVIWNYAPNIVFLHCHTEEGEFKRIKLLTTKIRKQLPNTFIIITYHPDIDEDYRKEYLHGYEMDILIPEFHFDLEKIKNIISIYKDMTARNNRLR